MAVRRGSSSTRARMVAPKVGARRDALKSRASNGGGGASARYQVAEMQRARLLAAAAATIGELGYAGASVAHVTARARVSRRTFYDLFANREDCLLALLEDVVERISGEMIAADLDGLSWRERVRGGLLAILSFFDREPVLARVCVVDALQGGPRVLAWREGVLAGLTGVLDEGRLENRAGSRECTSLTAEGLVGAAFAIVHARLISKKRHGPLRDLAGELMSLIVLPYLGPGAARAEQERALPPLPGDGKAESKDIPDAGMEPDPDLLAGVPMRLTYRTALVLNGIAKQPGASNRIVGESAGIFDQGQVSKLLARLQRLGLTVNTGVGHTKGEPNAWSLTPLGVRVASRLGATDRDGRAGA